MLGSTIYKDFWYSVTVIIGRNKLPVFIFYCQSIHPHTLKN